MKRLHQTLIKVNNISGFLPCNLSQIISVVVPELTAIFSASELKIYLTDVNAEKEELAWFIAGGIVGAKQDCKVIKDGFPVIIEDDDFETDCSGCKPLDGAGCLCLPLVADKETLGCFSLKVPASRRAAWDELEVLVAIVNQVAVTIQRSRMIRRLQQEKEALVQANQEIRVLNQELTDLLSHLQAAQAQLIHSEKLAAVGRLAANLAHEINNPTGIILSRLDCLFWEQELPAELATDLQVVKRQTLRIAEITRNLLRFTRKSSLEKQMVDLAELVEETVGWLENQFRRQEIKTDLVLERGLFVEGNREQLQQVMVNLLMNAKDAILEGGLITIYLSACGEEVILEISDTGQGIPLLELDKIFEPFYTLKEPGKGTGLGLFVTYTIIREHLGQIRVESEPGAGTKFTLNLPVALFR